MESLAMASSIETLQARIAPLRARLASHSLYSTMRDARHLQIFMETHVFAVWDFMSLLKALQLRLTCTSVPWQPTRWPQSRRFINEIVLGEESDLFDGRAISHFELYLEAMQEAGADTKPIKTLLTQFEAEGRFDVESAGAPHAARRFVDSTFQIIETDQVHAIAAAFTFGREDVIPDMFRSLVRDLNTELGGKFSKFQWYLERHIEVDGEDHGPLALRLVSDLCGEEDARWEEATQAAESALQARLALWDGILSSLETRRPSGKRSPS